MRTHLKRLALPRTSRSGSAGFTLIEIMLAMGILAVGLVMVGAAFPTAIQQSKETAEDTTATLIFNNALAICRDKLRASDFPTNGDFAYVAGPSTQPPVSMPLPSGMTSPATLRIDITETAYPLDPVTGENPNNIPRYRWIAIGRLMATNSNDVQLVIVPYRTFGKPLADIPTVINVHEISSCTFDATNATMKFGVGTNYSQNKLHIGAPVVVMPNSTTGAQVAGSFAYITSLPVSNGALTGEAQLSNTLAGTGPYNVLLFGSPDNPANRGGRSPALGAYVARVTLKP